MYQQKHLRTAITMNDCRRAQHLLLAAEIKDENFVLLWDAVEETTERINASRSKSVFTSIGSVEIAT